MLASVCVVNGVCGGLVAGAVEADDEAVADQRVVAHALDRHQVLQTFGVRGLRQCGDQRQQRPAQCETERRKSFMISTATR